MAVARARSEQALPNAGPAESLRRVLTMRRRIGLGWSDAAYNEIVARRPAPLADHDREDWLYVFRQTASSGLALSLRAAAGDDPSGWSISSSTTRARLSQFVRICTIRPCFEGVFPAHGRHLPSAPTRTAGAHHSLNPPRPTSASGRSQLRRAGAGTASNQPRSRRPGRKHQDLFGFALALALVRSDAVQENDTLLPKASAARSLIVV